jgi:ubiquinone/menaquinone biosynthesis C-methylase UbiE
MSTLETYDKWHAQVAESEADRSTADAIWHKMVKRRLGEIVGKRVVEVGCGRGDFAIYLARQGADVTAVDFSPAAIRTAKARAERQGVCVNFLVADAQDTRLPKEDFDVVISCECLEHVPEPKRMAAELHRILRGGGRCLLTTPSYLNGTLLAWAYSWLRNRPYNSGAGVQPHENLFLFFRVARLLKSVGFSIRDMESRVFPFLLLPRVNPERLRVTEFHSRFWNRFFRPFGLHFLYDMQRPVA